jgi:hypothetical protein
MREDVTSYSPGEFTEVLEARTASIFRVENWADKQTSSKQRKSLFAF